MIRFRVNPAGSQADKLYALVGAPKPAVFKKGLNGGM